MDRLDWPEPPELGSREVHLWWAEVGREDPSLGSDWLSELERRRAERFRQERDRRRFVARQCLLRGILAGYVGAEPAELSFREGPHGKPYLEGNGGEDWDFNLSHSEERILFGVARGRELGVDLEAVAARDELEGMADLTFSSFERTAFESAGDAVRLAAFFRVWTRKEAALKALGDGFAREPRTLHVGLGDRVPGEVWTPDEPVLAAFGLADVAAPKGFAAAVCAAGKDWAPVFVVGWERSLRL